MDTKAIQIVRTKIYHQIVMTITGINMEVIGPTNRRCGAFVTTTIFLYNIFIVRLHLERGMIDIRNQVADEG